MSMSEIETFKDISALASRAADIFQAASQEAIQSRGQFFAALSGGTTPVHLFDRLACDPYAARIDWSKTRLFWSDERCVPPNHSDSNYLRAVVHLISRISIPRENVYRIRGELAADQAAAAYEAELRGCFNSLPVFDLVLLGLGPDGHTASLFPHSPVLDEKAKWVVGVQHAAPPPPLVDRVSLTLPVINAARQVVFLVAGADKAAMVARIIRTPCAEPLLPAQRVAPTSGKLKWLIDQPALGNLDEI